MVDLLSIVIAIYIFTILWSYKVWISYATFQPGNQSYSTSISVVIAVRNEGASIAHLLEGLNHQTYNMDLVEVIIINDHSDDDTKLIVEQAEVKYQLKLLQATGKGKKEAITQGVHEATGELIVTTDGDCSINKNWLKTIVAFYKETDAVLISGPVAFKSIGTLFQRLQEIEFSGLIGIGASSMMGHFPTMCNGANLTYKREAFLEVGGYENDAIQSGDDEFLMHKLAKRYKDRILYLKSPLAIVKTEAEKSVKGFVQQRKRWASKWGSYKNSSSIVSALFILVTYLLIILAIGATILGKYSIEVLMCQLCFKAFIDYLFLSAILRFNGTRLHIIYFLMVFLLYPFYAVFFGFLGRFGSYNWKGRKVL